MQGWRVYTTGNRGHLRERQWRVSVGKQRHRGVGLVLGDLGEGMTFCSGLDAGKKVGIILWLHIPIDLLQSREAKAAIVKESALTRSSWDRRVLQSVRVFSVFAQDYKTAFCHHPSWLCSDLVPCWCSGKLLMFNRKMSKAKVIMPDKLLDVRAAFFFLTCNSARCRVWVQCWSNEWNELTSVQ